MKPNKRAFILEQIDLLPTAADALAGPLEDAAGTIEGWSDLDLSWIQEDLLNSIASSFDEVYEYIDDSE